MNTNLSMNNIVDWTTTSDLVGNVKVDEVGVLDRVSSLATRSIKRESKLDALEKIVRMCDLTTLEGEDTEGKIRILVPMQGPVLLRSVLHRHC